LAVKCIPLFKKSSDPSIVNITSLGAYFLNRSCCEFSYAQSKAAGTFPVISELMIEEHMTRMMSAGLMPFKIRVNSICPGTPSPLLVFREGLMIGLFHSNLTTDDKGNLWPPMEEATKNIPKGYASWRCKWLTIVDLASGLKLEVLALCSLLLLGGTLMVLHLLLMVDGS
jgi:NAD(P)-dependent dehydrogenase (short-subunit alcohol dehydrogenase family)